MDKIQIDEIVNKFQGQARNFIIIVKEIPNENVIAGKFDTSSAVDKNEKYRKGIVVSVGDQCPKDEDSVKVGDTILFDSYKGSPLTLNAIQYQNLFYSDIIYSF